ncbi:MAG: hypothetical protein ACO1N9_00785 [Flavobacterium sp.]
MFQNIQKKMLLRHPLLWNTRIIPILALALALHIIFFIIGYIHGAIDFTPQPDEYLFDATTGIITFFSIAISVLIFIFWLVYYTRNNAFKSFYPKSSLSLFKEWLIIFLVCILNSAYFGSYLFGEDVRARGYFSKEEFSRRITIISMASLFADGGFIDDGDYHVEVNGETELRHRDYTEYAGKKYPLKSLINKDLSSFTYQTREKDSINQARVKKWLVNNSKDSALWVMREFDKIAAEHGAKGNITPQRWLELTYHAPEFTDYITVGRVSRYDRDDNSSRFGHNSSGYDDETTFVLNAPGEGVDLSKIDTISNVVKVVDNQTIIYPKYYVPLKQMEDSYSDISRAYTSPSVDDNFMVAVLYFSMCFSLAIFSFRVTSGRDFIIALLAFGVTALITGIFQIVLTTSIGYAYRVSYQDNFYFMMWLIIIAVLLALFLNKKHTKGRSAIFLNVVLWLCPWVVIALFGIAKDFMYVDDPINGVDWKLSPTGQWINDNFDLIMFGNILIIIVFMCFMATAIRRWKGVPEA